MNTSRLCLSASIPESFDHIINPVACQAVQYAVSLLGYRDYFKDDITVVHDTRVHEKTTDENGNAKLYRNRVIAKVQPNINPSNNRWEGNGTTIDLGNGNMLINNPNGGAGTRTPWKSGQFTDRYFSVFKDDDNYIDLTERTVGSTLTMEVTMYFADVTPAVEALSRVYECFTNGDKIGYIDVQYDYPVPLSIQQTLMYLYSLRGPREGVENDNVLKWVTEESRGAITKMINRNDPKKQELVVNKNHFQALYLIECNMDAPTPSEPAGASVTFTLTVQYARSHLMVLEYPIIVNNNYVDFAFVPVDPVYRQGTDSPIMWENYAYTKFWEGLYAKSPRPYMYPWWDPWIVPDGARTRAWDYYPIASIALTLDNPEDPTAVTELNLKDDLPGIKLSDELIAIMAQHKNKCFGITLPFNITVYADDFMVSPELLDLSDGQTLKIKKKRTNSVIRVVFSLTDKVQGVRQVNNVWIVTFFPRHADKSINQGVKPPSVRFYKKGKYY